MITKTIPSYLFQQYADDNDLQAFVSAFNQLSQGYLDWFNALNLPIYTQLQGNLLDWVGQGVYGIARPTLQTGNQSAIGPYNSFLMNGLSFNSILTPAIAGNYVTDDIYQRVITWNFYKGDGQVFNFHWLKRKIIRFLFGLSGNDVEISSVYGISITISGTVITINIETANMLGSWTDINGIIYYGLLNPANYLYDNTGSLLTDKYGSPLTSVSTNSGLSAIALVLQNALQSGACPLPFQYTYIIEVT